MHQLPRDREADFASLRAAGNPIFPTRAIDGDIGIGLRLHIPLRSLPRCPDGLLQGVLDQPMIHPTLTLSHCCEHASSSASAVELAERYSSVGMECLVCQGSEILMVPDARLRKRRPQTRPTLDESHFRSSHSKLEAILLAAH